MIHHSSNRPPLLAVDPGREKCGLAVVTFGRQVLEQDVITTEALPMRIAHYVGKFGIETIVLGDRTGARQVRDALRQAGFQQEIVFVDEDRSSEMGRRRFLQQSSTVWWKRLLPIGLRTPDRPYDDYVAIVLAERYLDGSRSTRMRPARKKNAPAR